MVVDAFVTAVYKIPSFVLNQRSPGILSDGAVMPSVNFVGRVPNVVPSINSI